MKATKSKITKTEQGSRHSATFVIKALSVCGGGAERVLSHIVGELARLNWDITILTFDAEGATSFYPLHPEVCWIRLGEGPWWSRHRATAILWRAWRLRRFLSSEAPEHLVAFMSSSSVSAALALVGHDTDFIVSEHIVLSYYDHRRLERHLLGRAFHRARAVTMITPSMLHEFQEYWKQPAYVLMPNPVPRDLEPADLCYAPTQTYRIIAAGTLEPRKNFETLIEAFALLAARHPAWTVVIHGDGPMHGELEARVQSLGLGDKIHLPGSTPDLLTEMRASHIFAMPSQLESFGMVSLEAMSVGLPVVGLSHCPGTNEVVLHEQTGLLVESTDCIAGFAAALERLMVDPSLRERLGRAGQDSTKKYDCEKIARLWHDLLLGSGRDSPHRDR